MMKANEIKAQLLEWIAAYDGNTVFLADCGFSRIPVHFSRKMKAAQALAKKGEISFDGARVKKL